MKKSIVLFAVTSLVCVSTYAQNTTTARSTNNGGLILKGGVNRANITVTEDGRIDDANTLTSFNVGIGVDIPLADGLSLQPSLLFTGKGAKTEQGDPNSNTFYMKSTANPYYVELPLSLVGKIPLTESTRLFIGAGPYAAVGVAGKNKVESRLAGLNQNSERKIVFSDDNPFTRPEENGGYGKLKRFDYGFNATAGLDFNKFMIGAGYGHGLTKINSNTTNNANDQGKHRVWSVNLGVKL